MNHDILSVVINDIANFKASAGCIESKAHYFGRIALQCDRFGRRIVYLLDVHIRNAMFSRRLDDSHDCSSNIFILQASRARQLYAILRSFCNQAK
jgi:hypothetical protein